jgi:hypothetical protein
MSGLAGYQKNIEQSGNVTPGHVLAWTTDGVAQDAGTPNAPFATTLGLINNSLTAFGIASAPTTGPFQQMALGFNPADGNAALSINSFNGAQEVAFEVIVNGVKYPFPGAGGGNVVGPGSSTGGDVALWNGNTGALLKDGGNAKVTGSLVVTVGAFGSGDGTRAVNLSDFLDVRGGDEAYQFIRFPNGDIMQSSTGVNTTGADFIAFPNAFPNACNVVIATSGNATEWGALAPQPVVCGTQQLLPNEFALYMAKFNNIAEGFILTGGLTYRYIAFGY